MLSFPAKGSIRTVKLYPEPKRAGFGSDEAFDAAHAAWSSRSDQWKAVDVRVELLARKDVQVVQHELNAVVAEESEIKISGKTVPLEMLHRDAEMARKFVLRCVKSISGITIGGIDLSKDVAPERLVELVEDCPIPGGGSLLMPVFFSALVAQEVSPEERTFPESAGVG